jgi:hypothetical protein
MNKLTQINLYDGGEYKGFGPLGLESGSANADVVFQNFISSAIGIISLVAVIWFVFIILIGGISYMNAGPDQKTTEGARKRITNGLVGLIITIFGIFIVRLAGEIFNIPNILQVPSLLNNIQIKP